MTTRHEMIAEMRRVIRTAEEAIAKLRAGDYSAHRYCGGPGIAEFIIHNRYQAAIDGAERVIDANTLPEDLA
jgi:hypothetical protein